jgi:hypothetical protein
MSLAQENARFAIYVVRRMGLGDEYVSYAYEGMAQAEKSYDPTKSRFTTYAARAMVDRVRKAAIRDKKNAAVELDIEHAALDGQQIKHRLMTEALDRAPDQKLLNMLLCGMEVREIAKKLKITYKSAQYRIGVLTRAVVLPDPEKPRNPVVASILKAKKSGESLKDISRRMGKCDKWAYYVLRREGALAA